MLIKRRHNIADCMMGKHIKDDSNIGIAPRQDHNGQGARCDWICPCCEKVIESKGVQELTDSEVKLFNELIEESNMANPLDIIKKVEKPHYRTI